MSFSDRISHIAGSDTFRAALVLAILLNVSFFPYLWGGKTLLSAASDVPSIYPSGAGPKTISLGAVKVLDSGAPGWQTEPFFAEMHRALVVEKRLPLWNPSVGYGEPLAADMISQPYFPLSIIMLWHPSPAAYNWWCVAHYFIAGFGAFCFLRLFTSFWPALTGGILLMYAGYYLVYYDIPHLSVETLIPWVFFANERLVRSPRFSSVLVAAVVNVLIYLGGMPESALLVLAFADLYAAYRVLTDSALRANVLRIGGALIAQAVAGVGGAAFLLVPFIEYVRLSQDQHQASNIGGVIVGLQHDTFLVQALTYAVPLIFGGPWNNVTTNLNGGAGIRGFFGIAAIFLSFVAIFGALADRRRRLSAWTGILPFFALAACVLLMKRFGSPLVNWIGGLPGFSLIGFPKYEEALTAFAVAVLAALGVARIAEARSSGVARWWAAVVALGLLTLTFIIVRTMVTATMAGIGFTNYSLSFAIVILALLVIVSALPQAAPSQRLRTASLAGIVAIVALEAIGDYLIPIHYLVNRPPSANLDPYAGAPYIAFLQAATRDSRARVIGQDSLLYPDWAGAFGLRDVRDLDAMYDRSYLQFVRALLDPDGTDLELKDRFTQAPQLDTPNQLRFLALSSVQYIATNHVLDPSESFFGRAYTQNIGILPPEKIPGLVARRYTIGGIEREGLLEHPPFDELPLRVTIPRGAKRLNFGIGMDPAVYAPGVAICGAGAAFSLAVRADGRVTSLMQRYVDPKHNLAERRWTDQSVDVAPWAGKTVDFLLSTAPGPENNLCADWAVWGGGHFSPHDIGRAANAPFSIAYRDQNALVYRFARPLPRISIYEQVALTDTSDAALKLLADPSFDITRTAAITPANGQDPSVFSGMRGASDPVSAGVLLDYDSAYVRAHVVARRRSLVVLNDTDFPGWNAYIDGKLVPVFRANALFRGIAVDAGSHEIEFKYEPASFRFGLGITLVTIASGFVGAVLSARKRRRLPLKVAA